MHYSQIDIIMMNDEINDENSSKILREEILKKFNDITKLKEKIICTDVLINDTNKKHEENDQLRKRLEVCDQIIEQYKNQVENLSLELKSTLAELMPLRKENEISLRKTTNLQMEINKLNQQLDSYKGLSHQSEAANLEKETKLVSLEHEIKELKIINKKLESGLQRSQNNLESTISELKNIKLEEKLYHKKIKSKRRNMHLRKKRSSTLVVNDFLDNLKPNSPMISPISSEAECSNSEVLSNINDMVKNNISNENNEIKIFNKLQVKCKFSKLDSYSPYKSCSFFTNINNELINDTGKLINNRSNLELKEYKSNDSSLYNNLYSGINNKIKIKEDLNQKKQNINDTCDHLNIFNIDNNLNILASSDNLSTEQVLPKKCFNIYLNKTESNDNILFNKEGCSLISGQSSISNTSLTDMNLLGNLTDISSSNEDDVLDNTNFFIMNEIELKNKKTNINQLNNISSSKVIKSDLQNPFLNSKLSNKCIIEDSINLVSPYEEGYNGVFTDFNSNNSTDNLINNKPHIIFNNNDDKQLNSDCVAIENDDIIVESLINDDIKTKRNNEIINPITFNSQNVGNSSSCKETINTINISLNTSGNLSNNDKKFTDIDQVILNELDNKIIINKEISFKSIDKPNVKVKNQEIFYKSINSKFIDDANNSNTNSNIKFTNAVNSNNNSLVNIINNDFNCPIKYIECIDLNEEELIDINSPKILETDIGLTNKRYDLITNSMHIFSESSLTSKASRKKTSNLKCKNAMMSNMSLRNRNKIEIIKNNSQNINSITKKDEDNKDRENTSLTLSEEIMHNIHVKDRRSHIKEPAIAGIMINSDSNNSEFTLESQKNNAINKSEIINTNLTQELSNSNSQLILSQETNALFDNVIVKMDVSNNLINITSKKKNKQKVEKPRLIQTRTSPRINKGLNLTNSLNYASNYNKLDYVKVPKMTFGKSSDKDFDLAHSNITDIDIFDELNVVKEPIDFTKCNNISKKIKNSLETDDEINSFIKITTSQDLTLKTKDFNNELVTENSINTSNYILDDFKIKLPSNESINYSLVDNTKLLTGKSKLICNNIHLLNLKIEPDIGNDDKSFRDMPKITNNDSQSDKNNYKKQFFENHRNINYDIINSLPISDRNDNFFRPNKNVIISSSNNSIVSIEDISEYCKLPRRVTALKKLSKKKCQQLNKAMRNKNNNFNFNKVKIDSDDDFPINTTTNKATRDFKMRRKKIIEFKNEDNLVNTLNKIKSNWNFETLDKFNSSSMVLVNENKIDDTCLENSYRTTVDMKDPITKILGNEEFMSNYNFSFLPYNSIESNAAITYELSSNYMVIYENIHDIVMNIFNGLPDMSINNEFIVNKILENNFSLNKMDTDKDNQFNMLDLISISFVQLFLSVDTDIVNTWYKICNNKTPDISVNNQDTSNIEIILNPIDRVTCLVKIFTACFKFNKMMDLLNYFIHHSLQVLMKGKEFGIDPIISLSFGLNSILMQLNNVERIKDILYKLVKNKSEYCVPFLVTLCATCPQPFIINDIWQPVLSTQHFIFYSKIMSSKVKFRKFYKIIESIFKWPCLSSKDNDEQMLQNLVTNVQNILPILSNGEAENLAFETRIAINLLYAYAPIGWPQNHAVSNVFWPLIAQWAVENESGNNDTNDSDISDMVIISDTEVCENSTDNFNEMSIDDSNSNSIEGVPNTDSIDSLKIRVNSIKSIKIFDSVSLDSDLTEIQESKNIQEINESINNSHNSDYINKSNKFNSINDLEIPKSINDLPKFCSRFVEFLIECIADANFVSEILAEESRKEFCLQLINHCSSIFMEKRVDVIIRNAALRSMILLAEKMDKSLRDILSSTVSKSIVMLPIDCLDKKTKTILERILHSLK